MKTKLTIMLLSLILLGCKKENKDPVKVKQTFSVTVTGSGYIHEFTVNGKEASSPAIVYTGDKVYVYIVTYHTNATCSHVISLDGTILSKQTNGPGIKFNLQVK